MDGRQKKNRCSACGVRGHNARTCASTKSARVAAAYRKPPPAPVVSDDSINEEDFWAFAATVPVTSKDHGLIYITEPWGTQTHLISTVFSAIRRGIRQFFVHKGRQVGCTEIIRILTLYLLAKIPGYQGTFIADDDENKDVMRTILAEMSRGCPGMPELIVNNARQMAWANGSRLFIQAAGVRERRKKKLGVGRGIAYAHCTEAPLWLTKAITAYLRSAFSATHPWACYFFEGTARGKNEWFDIWRAADDRVAGMAVFLACWIREDYRLQPETEGYRKYWDGRLTTRERRWLREVERRYGVTLTTEFFAWRRMYVEEQCEGAERTADQEMPVLPEDAFEATGISFLPEETIRRVRRTVASAPASTFYRYEFGAHIEDTRCKRSTSTHGSLEVWESPEPAMAYVVSAVPAFSANPREPAYVASVWKATRDALTQVAEFADEECGMQPFAWITIHLASEYNSPRKAFIVETAGLGLGVFDEIRMMQSTGWGTAKRQAVREVMGGMNHHIWRRPDSMSSGGSYQWKTTVDIRGWLLNRFRDQVVNGAVVVRSEAMLVELERMRQDADEFIPDGADGREHRILSGAMAVQAWAKQLRPLFEKVLQGSRATDCTGRLMESFFDRLRRQPVRA